MSVKRTYMTVIWHTYATVADGLQCTQAYSVLRLVTLECTRGVNNPLHHCRHSARDRQYDYVSMLQELLYTKVITNRSKWSLGLNLLSFRCCFAFSSDVSSPVM